MKAAALTFVYNELVNLPIWLGYYGRNFGSENLFVVDRQSTDGSTSNIGPANRIVIPRDELDERKKTDLLTSMQNALLSSYDVVVCGDCDELVVPRAGLYADLADYVSRMEFDYATCIGINILHIMNREPPLNLREPILAQRRYALFYQMTCKTVLSRVPLRWALGMHAFNHKPRFDENLFLFHTKTMDYGIASARQKINSETPYSERALSHGWAAHHRYGFEQFVRENFLDRMNAVGEGKVAPFEFAEEIAKLESEAIEREGFYHFATNIAKIVEIPVEMRSAF